MRHEIECRSSTRGKTILLTTHYLEEADLLASNLAIVNRGKVVVEGTPEALKAQLQGDAIHVELAHEVAGLVETVGALDGVNEVEVDGRWLHARAASGARAVPVVLSALEGQDVDVVSVTVARPSLDDVYLRHTGRAFARADEEGAKR